MRATALPADCVKLLNCKLPHMNFLIYGSRGDSSQLWIVCDAMDTSVLFARPVEEAETLMDSIRAMIKQATQLITHLAIQELTECCRNGKDAEGNAFYVH